MEQSQREKFVCCSAIQETHCTLRNTMAQHIVGQTGPCLFPEPDELNPRLPIILS